MVDVMGHFAMGLLWAAPAWILWDGRVSAAFVGLTLATAMLPDVDLVLSQYLPIAHHGITHTVVFVLGVALAAGAVVEWGLRSRIERAWLRAEGHGLSTGALFAFVFGAFALGGLSHLFADVLSAPDVSQPLEPFWPLITDPLVVDLIWYNAVWWNAVLLAVALVIHIGLAYLDLDVEHPYRIYRRA